MQQFLEMVSAHFVPSLIGFCVLVAMLLKSVTVIVGSVTAERTRREIAAYIAEGSLTPEQGEKLLKADVGKARGCNM